MKTFKNFTNQVFLLAILGAAFITGCQKEGMKEVPAAIEALSFDPNGAYFMGPDGSLQKIDLEGQQNGQDLTFRNGNGNSHVNAHYSFQPNSISHGFYKSHTVQINATENNQGVNGAGHVWRTYGDEGEFAYHIIMDADCLESNGEEAVFAGIVTQLTGEDNGIPPVGSRVWIRVKDNGQGPNAPLDQYHPAIIWNAGATIPCEVFGVNSIIWSILAPNEDVANSSDNIRVK